MPMKTSLLSLFLLSASTLQADLATAKRHLQEGSPAAAVQALKEEHGEEANFWRGRALIALERLAAAAEELRQVSATHPLYTAAAKALLYCAWQCPEVDFAATVTPMATSENTEIAHLATAALAEYWLQKPRSRDNAAMERLRKLADQHPNLRNILQILEVDNLRQREQFEEAIALCRALEAGNELTTFQKHYIRLSLSEVFYAKEKATANTPESAVGTPIPELSDDDEDGPTLSAQISDYNEGKGEETLLHFISTHPESPLLEEAFRRLWEHKAFETSDYAKRKLEEWMANPQKARRAAIALLLRQRLLSNNLETWNTPDVSSANTAIATCPQEQTTRTILLEQVRLYIQQEQNKEAALYLNMIQGEDARTRYYHTRLLPDKTKETAQAYLDCAKEAPEDIRNAALVNALLCALHSGDKEMEEHILSLPDVPPHTQYQLLSARVAHRLASDPAQAAQDLATLRSMEAPSTAQKLDTELDYACYLLHENIDAAIDFLASESTQSSIKNATEAQLLRYIAIQEKAFQQNTEGDEIQKAAAAEPILRKALTGASSHRVQAILTLRLAHLLSLQGKHSNALKTLHTLVRNSPDNSPYIARATYMAAQESELVGTLRSLKRAEYLYGRCMDTAPELHTKACIHRAAILVRLGQFDKADELLQHMLRQQAPLLRPEDKVLIYAVQANGQALSGNAEGRNKAVEISAAMVNIPNLPRRWRFRALLHHALFCSRAGMHEQSLEAYRKVLEMNPAMGAKPEQAEWLVFYSAGTGEVVQLLHLERFEEAAIAAEKVAGWNPATANPKRVRQFTNWAKFIRQTRFIPY